MFLNQWQGLEMMRQRQGEERDEKGEKRFPTTWKMWVISAHGRKMYYEAQYKGFIVPGNARDLSKLGKCQNQRKDDGKCTKMYESVLNMKGNHNKAKTGGLDAVQVQIRQSE
jgi:hypothetical protein